VYVIVYCGYEGIDHVLWAGEEGAGEACLRVRKRIIDNLERVGLPPKPDEDDEGWSAALDEWYELKRKVRDIMSWSWWNMDDPDRVCVMKDVGDFEYRCCCEELGVGTGKGWLH